MSKKNIVNTATAEVLNGITITINQHLHGIEVKGEVDARDDKWLRENGFWFSKRKGHYWTNFDKALYEKVRKHFNETAKPKTKTIGKTLTLAEVAPIDMKDMPFVDDVKLTKSKKKQLAPLKRPEPKDKKAVAKKETKPSPAPLPIPVPSEPVTQPKGDALEEWKRQVILAVEKILDESIEAITKGEAA